MWEQHQCPLQTLLNSTTINLVSASYPFFFPPSLPSFCMYFCDLPVHFSCAIVFFSDFFFPTDFKASLHSKDICLSIVAHAFLQFVTEDHVWLHVKRLPNNSGLSKMQL